MQQRRHAENHDDGDELVVRGDSTRSVAEYRFGEWTMAYSRFYEKHFLSAAASAAEHAGDGPLLDRVFPRCGKTERALADVRDAEWLLDLLADLVVASRPCSCERGSDVVSFCACVRDTAVVFKAATVECRGGDDGEARRAGETDDEHHPCRATAGDDTVHRHVRAAAHHAKSALKCRCGGSTDQLNPCLHWYLLNTVFSEKLHRSCLRHSHRGPRDAETQTPGDDESRTPRGGDDTDRVTVQDPRATVDRRVEKTRGWKLFRWLRRRDDVTAEPAAVVKPPKVRRQVKYIQVRVHPKRKKPRAIPAAEQTVVVGPEAAAPVTGPPDDACAGRGPTADDRDDGGAKGKVKSGTSRWSVLRWLRPRTATDSTAPTKIRDTPPSGTRPTELKTTKSSSSSDSLCVSFL